MFSAPKPKPPPPPPNAPVMANADMVQAGEARASIAGNQTIATGPQGLLTPARTGRKTLMGE